MFAFIVAISFIFFFPTVSNSRVFNLADNSRKDQKSKLQPIDVKSLESLAEKLSSTINSNHPELRRNSSGTKLPECFTYSAKPVINSSLSINQQFASTFYLNKFQTPGFITGFPLNKNKNSANLQTSSLALSYIAENKQIFKLQNPADELKLQSQRIDAEGNKHLNFEQFYIGVPVWGKEITMHYDKENNLYLINSVYIPTPLEVSFTENITEAVAVRNSLENLKSFSKIEKLDETIGNLLNYHEPSARKCIWVDDNSGNYKLAWFVSIRPDVIHNWYYFVDAATGNILEKYDNSPSDGPATANALDLSGSSRKINTYLYQGSYYMWDVSRTMFSGTIPNANGMIISYTNNNGDVDNAFSPKPFSSQNNSWSDAASVSSQYNTGLIYEYYKNTHSRNSIDDKGMDMITVLHVTQGGKSIDNAWWNGKFVTLGDGDQITTPWSGALDFMAHEFTHGVVTFTVDLVYKFQSGALNEAFADWGGCMVDRNNWTLGEAIAKKSFFPTGCVRDMANPHNGGTQGDNVWLPAHMNEFMDLTVDKDNGGVHYNCGIINKATYLIGTAITKEKLEKIYYRVLNNKYINKEAKFIDMRLASVKAAQELFGNTSAEVTAVKKAFDDVGIIDGNGTNPNPDKPQIQGDEWIAVIGSADLSLYKVRPVITDLNKDIVHLTQTQLYTSSGGVITIPDKGNFILFIDADNNVRYINPDGTGEAVLSSQGNWASISVSPDGKYLAAIALNDTKPQIYLFDLSNSSFTTIDVYVPSTTSTSLYKEPLSLSSLTWNNNGTYLMYDAQNYELRMDGTEVIYWDLNMVDIQKGVVLGVFPPQQDGIQVGDPSFSKNSEYLFVFDIYDLASKMGQISGANLFSGEVGTIFSYNSDNSVASYGSYSIDDKKVAFQYWDNSAKTYSVSRANLDTKKINSVGQAQVIATNSGLPKWFATGSRPNSVNDNSNTNTKMLAVSPNPASSECVIALNGSGSEILNLGVYDLNGNEMISLNDRIGDNFGLKLLDWNCTGQDGSKLATGCYYIKILYKNETGQIKAETTPLILAR